MSDVASILHSISIFALLGITLTLSQRISIVHKRIDILQQLLDLRTKPEVENE